MRQNPYFEKVSSRYLFQEIAQRVKEYKKSNPTHKLISLGIGDTTEPVVSHVASELTSASSALGTREGYSGYGQEPGTQELRAAISEVIYNGQIAPEDIFVSDGAKCDIGRLQILFGPDAKIALQDPTYPAYLDSALIYRGDGITLLPCLAENNFIPDYTQAKGCDVLFLCLPNNPTGTVISKDVLEKIVRFAKENQITIVFDAAYSFFVQEGVTKSIYEIEGASEVAIELGSFSKIAGFSGVRLGWTVVPKSLRYRNGKPVQPDWSRINATFFNGASILSQKGGLAVLSPKGLKEVKEQVAFYLENIQLIKNSITQAGVECFGGENSPYLWVRIPPMSSWQLFELLLSEAEIVTTPGVGFGQAGDGFIRISGFAKRADIITASCRLAKILNLQKS